MTGTEKIRLETTLATGEGGEGGGRTGEKAADGGGRRRWRVSRRVAVADEIAASPPPRRRSLSPRRGLFPRVTWQVFSSRASEWGWIDLVGPIFQAGPNRTPNSCGL